MVAWRADDSETVSYVLSYVLALALALVDFNRKSTMERTSAVTAEQPAGSAGMAGRIWYMVAMFRVRLWLGAASDTALIRRPGVDLQLRDRGGTGLGKA